MSTELNAILRKARSAAITLGQLPTAQKNVALKDLAAAILRSERAILAANQRDFAKLPKNYALADRLLLTPERVQALAAGVRAVAALPDPVGHVLEKRTLRSGLKLQRVSTPIGVIGVIYEARPNVTVEIFSLMLKSGNAVVLRGGRDAYETNQALLRIIRATLKKYHITPHAAALLNPLKKALARDLMHADNALDLLIPRGGKRLIETVRKESTVPVIETGAGVCHMYVEKSAKLDWAVRMVVNAKTRRPSVCNALDTLVLDEAILRRFFAHAAPELATRHVALQADAKAYAALTKISYPKTLLRRARPSDFGKEFLSLRAAVKTVPGWQAGLAHVAAHTSGHSEGIVTENSRIAKTFTDTIDAAAVYVNAPISFTDGFEFGLGAEIGISTQKLHARGPMALRELTTYKWIIRGKGQVRPA